MTDDVTVDNGTLTDYVVSADAATADGALVQRVKLAYSADGSTTHVAADADGLLVNLGANNDVTVTGTVTASDGGGTLSVDDGGSSLTVDGSVSISGSVAVTDNSGSLTVDNAGTFAVQAAQSGTWTVQPGNTANTVAWKVDGSAVTQPVSIAAAVPVTDNSGSLTVDDGASSLTVDAPVGTPVFVRLSDGSSAISTLPVSLASVPSHAVTNAGTFAVQDSEKIADNAGFTDGTTKVLPTGYVYDEVAGTSLTENDIAAARIDVKRAQVLVLEDGTTRGQKAAVSAAGRLSVDGSGVTQPVSGTVTANLAAGTNAIGKLAANSGVTIGAVEIAAAQTLATVTTVGAVTSITNALPAGTNAIGKLAANSGVDIGDVDVTSVTPGTSATSLGKAADSVAGATDTGVAILAIRDDSLTTLTPADGDYAPLRVNSTGALHVTGGGGGTQYQEDAAHTTGDTGTMALAVRKDTAAALAGSDGDYTPLITDANGALHVAVASGSVTASGTIDVDGTVAHDAADSGDPLKIGHKAASSLPTAVADADRANSISDTFGRQLTGHIDPAMQTWKNFSATSTSVGHMIWNPASGKRIAVTNLQIGTTGSVASDLVIWFGDTSDTTYTAGTDQVLFDGTFVPSSSAAPGAVIQFNPPAFCTTANRKLRFSQPSSMQTKITVYGYEW